MVPLSSPLHSLLPSLPLFSHSHSLALTLPFLPWTLLQLHISYTSCSDYKQSFFKNVLAQLACQTDFLWSFPARLYKEKSHSLSLFFYPITLQCTASWLPSLLCYRNSLPKVMDSSPSQIQQHFLSTHLDSLCSHWPFTLPCLVSKCSGNESWRNSYFENLSIASFKLDSVSAKFKSLMKVQHLSWPYIEGNIGNLLTPNIPYWFS